MDEQATRSESESLSSFSITVSSTNLVYRSSYRFGMLSEVLSQNALKVPSRLSGFSEILFQRKRERERERRNLKQAALNFRSSQKQRMAIGKSDFEAFWRFGEQYAWKAWSSFLFLSAHTSERSYKKKHPNEAKERSITFIHHRGYASSTRALPVRTRFA